MRSYTGSHYNKTDVIVFGALVVSAFLALVLVSIFSFFINEIKNVKKRW